MKSAVKTCDKVDTNLIKIRPLSDTNDIAACSL